MLSCDIIYIHIDQYKCTKQEHRLSCMYLSLTMVDEKLMVDFEDPNAFKIQRVLACLIDN